MPLGTVFGINRDIKHACKKILESRSSDRQHFKAGGDFTLTFYRLPRNTPAFPKPPITGTVSGFFVGKFVRENPYQDSDTVTREQFDDSMIMCQCHPNSFAERDVYETMSINDFQDFYKFLCITPLDESWELIRFHKQLTSRLRNWHIIENCGNFRTCTAEDDTYFLAFEMTTS